MNSSRTGKVIKVGFLLAAFVVLVFFVVMKYFVSQIAPDNLPEFTQVDEYLELRLSQELEGDENINPFAEDDKVSVLLLGLDSRVGETSAHCDAIQFLEIDRSEKTVKITAVPRGTYSPLPPGKGTTSSDYYVSNACGLGGLDYGVKQIERILGKKADYVAMVGFSQVYGILRYLKLPTTETLQWLRHRQGYAIGEPQRARNHSTFIKQALIKFVPENISPTDTASQYFIYKLIKTDLSFETTKKIVAVLSGMELKENPERISLYMKPPHNVQDIPYDEENLEEYLGSMIDPIKHLLSSQDYSGMDKKIIDDKIKSIIEENNENDEFIRWAYKNYLWLQMEQDDERMQLQWDITLRFIRQLRSEEDIEQVIADYILEMQHLGQDSWADRGRTVLSSKYMDEDSE